MPTKPQVNLQSSLFATHQLRNTDLQSHFVIFLIYLFIFLHCIVYSLVNVFISYPRITVPTKMEATTKQRWRPWSKLQSQRYIRSEETWKLETCCNCVAPASVSVHVTKIHFCLVQYKVRAYIQMKSSKACKREIKSVMNTAGNVSHFVLSFSTFTLSNLQEADRVQIGKQKKRERERETRLR